MTSPLRPTPADELGADLEPVWDRLADHADAAPHAGPELMARVQGALLTEFDKALRPTARRPLFVIRPLVRASSLRSLAAAAALVALLGASVALAGAGVARLYEPHPVLPTPTPAVEETKDDDNLDRPALIVLPPVQPGPGDVADPDGNDGNVDENADQGGQDGKDGVETDKPGDGDGADRDDPGAGAPEDEADKPDPDKPDADKPQDEPSDSPSDGPDESPAGHDGGHDGKPGDPEPD